MPAVEVNSQPVIVPPDNLISAAIRRGMAEFAAPHDTELRLATVDAFHRSGRNEPSIAPVVHAVSNIAIDACTSAIFLEHELPREVIERADSAAFVTNLAVDFAIRRGLFLRVYCESPALSTLFDEDPYLEANLTSPSYLMPHCYGPFYETARLAGGASLALSTADIPADLHADIIAQSNELLLAARIPKRHQRKVFNYLGSPYADPRNLRVQKGVEARDARVGFTDRSKRVLHKYIRPNAGCPAASIRLGGRGRDSVNLLTSSWKHITYYLLFDNAEITSGTR
jgi:hypothetical protein